MNHQTLSMDLLKDVQIAHWIIHPSLPVCFFSPVRISHIDFPMIRCAWWNTGFENIVRFFSTVPFTTLQSTQYVRSFRIKSIKYVNTVSSNMV
jgi:hypothetical protein